MYGLYVTGWGGKIYPTRYVPRYRPRPSSGTTLLGVTNHKQNVILYACGQMSGLHAFSHPSYTDCSL